MRIARLAGGGAGRRVRRDLAALERVARPVAGLLAAIYLLLLAAYYGSGRSDAHRLSPLTGLGAGLFHYVAAVLWLGLFIGSLDGGCGFRWTLLALALLAQAGGVAFVAARRRDDHTARQRGMKWMVAVPLIVAGGLFMWLVLGAILRAR